MEIETRKPKWWQDRFVTLMVIPERTRRVHKYILPFFALKLSAVVFALLLGLFCVLGLDYIHMLGQMNENKRLKGENFKLRQEVQLVRNKVDSMEQSVERLRNYAKKLQVLTGQGKESLKEKSPSKGQPAPKIEPKSEPPFDLDAAEQHSALQQKVRNVAATLDDVILEKHLDRMQAESYKTELVFSSLQSFLFNQRAVAKATPTLVPLIGYISSGFGYRQHPKDGVYRFHQGIDIVAEPGSPVRAPADGLVTYADTRTGYGKVIVIDHGYGIRSLFAHNSYLFVAPGSHVKRGDIISQVGSTGKSTGPHLHYEIRKNGMPVNPTAFLSAY